MSEKRYEIRTNSNGEHWLFDNKYDMAMMISKIRANLLVVCNRLNEQQGTISQLEQENEQLKHYKVYGDNKRLQTRIADLKETNRQLREINKEIGNDLHNCRLNKNIISEKLKLWQDTLAEYDIYTIKDLGESFELDAKLSKEKDEKIKELEVKVLNLELEIKRLEKMIWKIQWRFQQEVGIEKAREHYREIDKEMKG